MVRTSSDTMGIIVELTATQVARLIGALEETGLSSGARSALALCLDTSNSILEEIDAWTTENPPRQVKESHLSS